MPCALCCLQFTSLPSHWVSGHACLMAIVLVVPMGTSKGVRWGQFTNNCLQTERWRGYFSAGLQEGSSNPLFAVLKTAGGVQLWQHFSISDTSAIVGAQLRSRIWNNTHWFTIALILLAKKKLTNIILILWFTFALKLIEKYNLLFVVLQSYLLRESHWLKHNAALKRSLSRMYFYVGYMRQTYNMQTYIQVT